MFSFIKCYLKKFDYLLLFLAVLLAAISFTAILSAVYEPQITVVQAHPYKQFKTFIAGVIGFFVISFIGYRRLVKYAPVFYLVGCLLLVAVLVHGVVGMGAQRWLYIGPFRGQPSEFFKFVWVLMLAWIFADMKDSRMGIIKLSLCFLWVIPPFLLVFKQPDLGTAMTYLAVWGIVALFLGVKRKLLAILIILGVALTPIVWSHMKDYQRDRVITFIQPDKDPGGSGYQALQSKIAIGSGGLTGKGYMKGTQSHLRFMPERHTDFIFAVISEEFGFAGSITIIVLFFVLFIRILSISVTPKESQGKVLCIAVGGLIFFQFFINISMTMGIAPIVGVPLPFISYGGSSLFTFMCMLGLINSVYIHKNDSSC